MLINALVLVPLTVLNTLRSDLWPVYSVQRLKAEKPLYLLCNINATLRETHLFHVSYVAYVQNV